ncbi:MAG: FmdB family zinc ribbon protein [Bryobacteraceae bacterium]
MPIFEYACDDCGTKFERLVRRSETNAVRCPSCGQDHLTTQYSTFAAKTNGTENDCQPTGGCGAGMCQGGMCGMNMN